MVKKVSTADTPLASFAMKVVYDISDPIGSADEDGKTAPNSPDDVSLVQFFLSEGFASRRFKPLGKLVIDGVFGPMTHYWSLYFIRYTESRQTSLKFKKSYAHFLPFRSVSKDSGLTFMYQLNQFYFENNARDFDKLETINPRFPQLAKAKLALREARGTQGTQGIQGMPGTQGRR